MKKVLIGAIVSLLVLSALLIAVNATAEGSETGTFPNRTFSVTRSPPGGPKSDTYTTSINPTQTGMWWVRLESLAGAAMIVQVFKDDAGVLTLETSSKLREIGQESTHTLLMAGGLYKASFTPYGKSGTSTLSEHFAVPSPPTASFTYSPSAPTTADTVIFDASTSSDPDNDIVSYEWDFNNDGIVDATGVTASKQFTIAGTYTVVLKVTDSTGLYDTASQAVSVTHVGLAPVASFTVSRDLMTVSVDASASYDPDGTITSYAWNFGDGTTGSGKTATHVYTTAGKYTITLTVTDNEGMTGSTSRDVTVSTTTIDFAYHDFFGQPWGEFWDMRTFVYGDRPTLADCFNATGITDGYCTPKRADWPDVDPYPYTNWYPSPVDATGKFAFIYAPYRFDAQVNNHPAYNIDQPVILPRCDQLKAAGSMIGVTISCPTTMPSGGSVSIDLYLQYLDIAREVEIAFISDNCPDLTGSNDGFLIEETATLTLDSAAMAKIFGVTDPTQLGTLVKLGCGTASSRDTFKSGPLEMAYAQWLLNEGNGPYEIFASFEYAYTVLFLDMKASYNAGTGLYTVVLHTGTWGEEVLLARKFYWGATKYIDGAENLAVKPTGWWGMELAWFEDLRMKATISTSFSATLSGVMQYHLTHGADPGPDGVYKTADDVPTWMFAPILSDYIYGYGGHPYSELDNYIGYSYIHTTPGSKNYGLSGAYDYVPKLWPLKAGETQTLMFPTGVVELFDPYRSTGTTDGSGLVAISAALTLGYTLPAAYGSYDATTKTSTVIGPTSVGTVPTTTAGWPLESRPIFTLVK